MKGFRDHLDDIHRNFTMGFMTKELAIHNFEHLLKNASLMPRAEEFDPNMTDDEFLFLMSEALNLNPEVIDEHAERLTNPCAEINLPDKQDHQKQREADAMMAGGGERHYNPGRYGTRGTLGGNICPVCGKQKEIFSSIQDEHRKIYPVQPPRCEECMWEWADKNIINPYIPDTKMVDMKQDTWDFFRQYEQQMKGFSIK